MQLGTCERKQLRERLRMKVHTDCYNPSVNAAVPNTEGPSGCAAASLKSHFRMDFFSCPCLLSEAADWIKAIGFPQTLRVINISAEQMQNSADPPSRSEKTLAIIFSSFSFFFLCYSDSVTYTLKEKLEFATEVMLVIGFFLPLFTAKSLRECVCDLSCCLAPLFSPWRCHLSAARCVKQPCKKIGLISFWKQYLLHGLLFFFSLSHSCQYWRKQ